MKRISALLVLILAVALLAVGGAAAAAQESGTQQPNIVFILTDDLDYSAAQRMPNIKSLMVDQGATFENAYVAQPLCCPSRSTILTGMYTHNHNILSNKPPDGGFGKFQAEGHEQRVIAARLQQGGYSTGLFGKYLNYYGVDPGTATYVPPYWNTWFATRFAQSDKFGEGKYYNYYVNDGGTVRRYGTRVKDYQTDVISERARSFVRQRAPGGPFFAYIAPHAPHKPATPAKRHRSIFLAERAPRNPNFNEADVSDKPARVRELPPLTKNDQADIDALYRGRLSSMLAVDEMVAALVQDLGAARELDNTFIFFMSDNGWFQGEHRLNEGDSLPYEEAVKVPLFVRGPGIAPGKRIEELVLNTDIFATMADLTAAPSQGDGRSLMPLLRGESSADWRVQVLLENFGSSNSTYKAVRTERYKYVEYDTGEKELYDLLTDPHELNSLHTTADPALVGNLKRRLEALKDCAGESCRAAEDGP